MQVLNKWPPNIAEIQKVFPVSQFNPVFTYGNTLYNPTGGRIPPDLIAHEEIHEKQQAKMGAENWWKLYLENKSFRLEQEAEAYRRQYEYGQSNYNRQQRKSLYHEILKHLSSALYGNLITIKQAKELINE